MPELADKQWQAYCQMIQLNIPKKFSSLTSDNNVFFGTEGKVERVSFKELSAY
jgi:hypothetical protein